MKMSVMVATDGSEAGRQSSLYAVRLAQALPLKLTLVHAMRGLDRLEYRMIPDFQIEMVEQNATRHAQDVLEREAAALRERGVELERCLLLKGAPGPVLCAAAEEAAADLLLVGRKGHGDLQELLFGSTCSHVIHHSRRPVLVVNRTTVPGPDAAPEGPLRILVAIDESQASERVLAYLSGLAGYLRQGVSLTLVHVVNRDRPDLQLLAASTRYEMFQRLCEGGQDLLLAAAERLRSVGYRVKHRLEEGSTGKALCRLASEDQQEFVLLGRREEGEASHQLFGAVCNYVAHNCPAHVWIVT